MTSRVAGAGGRAPRDGFTLIEILMAMMVFLAGITGLFALMSTALAMHRDGLTAGQAVRRVDRVADELARQLAQGRHWNEADQRWIDVEPEALPDGGVYSVDWRARADGETVLALISIAADRKGLAAARPVPVLLPTGPGAAQASERWRQRARRRGPP